MRNSRKPPWKKPNPRKRKARAKLTPKQNVSARARAARAGRGYPNLVDNMWAASRGKARRRIA